MAWEKEGDLFWNDHNRDYERKKQDILYPSGIPFSDPTQPRWTRLRMEPYGLRVKDVNVHQPLPIPLSLRDNNIKNSMEDPEVIIGYTPNGVPIVRRESRIRQMIADPETLAKESVRIRREVIGNNRSLSLKVRVEEDKLHITITDKDNVALANKKKELALKNLEAANKEELDRQRLEYHKKLTEIEMQNEINRNQINDALQKNQLMHTPRVKRNPNTPDYVSVVNPETKEILHIQGPLSFRMAHYMGTKDKTEAVNAFNTEFGNDWLAKTIFVLSSKQYPITDWHVNDTFACTLFNHNTILIYKKPVPVQEKPEPEQKWNDEDLVESQLNWK